MSGSSSNTAALNGALLRYEASALSLLSSRWSDDAGNETAYLHIFEVGDDGLMCCEARFDEDDLDGAYRELQRRYYQSEGAAFARGPAPRPLNR